MYFSEIWQNMKWKNWDKFDTENFYDFLSIKIFEKKMFNSIVGLFFRFAKTTQKFADFVFAELLEACILHMSDATAVK